MNEVNAEIKIKEAARKVFLKKGMAGARMQEIADEAGINKALLHYYYRNKEQLFASVFQEIIKEFLPALTSILNGELPLEVKVYQVAEKYIDFLSVHPELPLFVLGELQRHPEMLIKKLEIQGGLNFDNLKDQLKSEVEAGNIRPISFEDFLMNLVSMLVFPFAGKYLFLAVTQMDNEDYSDFINRRKTEVPKYMMNALRI